MRSTLFSANFTVLESCACKYHSNSCGDNSHDLSLFYTHNEHMLVFEHKFTFTGVHPRCFTHRRAQRSWSLVPLLVTCNYVAMMSLISCIGWKLRNAERLESAGKCLAVRNTNTLICEQWLKGKCFSMHPPLLMFTSAELRLKGRVTD